MLFEDGNRIDLTLCPKEHIQEWVDSEADFTVLLDETKACLTHSPSPQSVTGQVQLVRRILKSLAMNFWWVSAYVVKGICRNKLIYATDHLYGICQQELLKGLSLAGSK